MSYRWHRRNRRRAVRPSQWASRPIRRRGSPLSGDQGEPADDRAMSPPSRTSTSATTRTSTAPLDHAQHLLVLRALGATLEGGVSDGRREIPLRLPSASVLRSCRRSSTSGMSAFVRRRERMLVWRRAGGASPRAHRAAGSRLPFHEGGARHSGRRASPWQREIEAPGGADDQPLRCTTRAGP
jgi:hypothetical protein